MAVPFEDYSHKSISQRLTSGSELLNAASEHHSKGFKMHSQGGFTFPQLILPEKLPLIPSTEDAFIDALFNKSTSRCCFCFLLGLITKSCDDKQMWIKLKMFEMKHAQKIHWC